MDSSQTLIVQKPEKAAQLILVFHGVGSNPMDMVPVAQAFAEAFPQAFVASVPGAFDSELAPAERQWFSITGIIVAGREKWVRVRAVFRFDAHGAPLESVGTTLDITERKAAEEQIRKLAFFDALTNLPNRRLLLDRLEQALAQAQRHHHVIALMFLDLDNFKTINDTLGHDVGDELLKHVAMRLQDCVRAIDTVSRQGGDEFVIVLDDIKHAANAAHIAQKIIDTLAQPVQVATRTLQITTSIGITVYKPGDGANTTELLKQADVAMYAAKREGRSRYCFFKAPAAVV